METEVTNPIVAALGAVAADAGAAAVTFGLINNTEVGVITTLVVGLASFGFIVANALHHKANNKA